MPKESRNHRFLLFRGSNGTDQSSRSGLFHADRQSIYFHCAGCKQLFRCKADLLGRHIIDVGGQLIAKLRMPVFRLPEHSPQAVGYREVFISQPVSDGSETESSTPESAIEAESATNPTPARPSFETTLQEEGRSATTRPGRKTSLGAGSLLTALGGERLRSQSLGTLASMSPDGASNSYSIPGQLGSVSGFNHPSLTQSHSRPVEVGLTASIPLAGRWSLMTGAEYALYKSRLGYSASTIMTQKAHYLGIPLRLDYDLVRRDRFRLYLGAGAKVDWGIAARLDGEKIDPDGFGLSLLGAGGLQWTVTGPLGLYLEPRFNWFLSDPEGRLKTFRTESPFRFALSAGIRVDL